MQELAYVGEAKAREASAKELTQEHFSKSIQDSPPRASDTAAVIVAAGRPTGPNPFDPTKRVGGASSLERIITTFQKAGVQEIVIVIGYGSKKLGKQLARKGVICLFNEAWRNSDMLESIKIGLAYVKDRFQRIFISPVDVPMFSLKTLEQLLDAKALAAVPVVDGISGHPLLLHHLVLEEIFQYQGDKGLRGVLEHLPGYIAVPVQDPGILIDFQSQPVSDVLLEHAIPHPVTASFHLLLIRDLPFFNEESCLLLQLIARTNSVRAACRQMNLSYSKGWKLLNTMESQLGFSVLTRHPGGPRGGESCLSREGEQLLENYLCLQQRMDAFLKAEFRRLFPMAEP